MGKDELKKEINKTIDERIEKLRLDYPRIVESLKGKDNKRIFPAQKQLKGRIVELRELKKLIND